ncbi:MAG: hypothetical protein U0Y10_26820 [Spirosomataceae bacterium]
MKTLSYWAKHHPRWAIALLVLWGTYEIAFGIRLGRVILPPINEALLHFLIVVIVLQSISIQNQYQRQLPSLDKALVVRLRQRCARWLFIMTFGLAVIFGNLVQQRLNPASATAVAWASEGNNSQPISKKQFRKQLKTTLKNYRKQHQQITNTTGLVIGGILLLLLGIGFAGTLACAIGCAAPALEIVLYGLLTIGSFWAGIYFLNKAARLKKANQASL